MSGVYLEPVGILHGISAREAIAVGGALPLAGGPLAFGAVRLWEGESGNVKHAIVRTATIQALDDSQVKDLLDRICAPRLSIAGLDFGTPSIMGILNVTPDSFSDGGDFPDADIAAEHGLKLIAEGADIVDVGGESTRPGADAVTEKEELHRVLPVIEKLAAQGVRLSIDTRKPDVMAAAAEAGVAMLNDISGLSYSSESLATAARLRLPVVIMHARDDPKTMQDNPSYKDVVVEVYDYLEARIEAAVAAGLPRSGLLADPGLGFGKTLNHNLALVESMSIFHGLGVPLLAGISRKKMVRDLTGATSPKDTIPGSIAGALAAVAQGVQIVRVHDVLATRQALAMWNAARSGSRR